MTRSPTRRVFPSPIQAMRWTACALLALLGLIAVPGAFAFAPPVGPINVAVALDTVSPKSNAHGDTLTRQTISNGTVIRHTVSRPGQTDVVFDTAITPNPGPGFSGFSITAAFIGTRGLLFKIVTGNTVTTPIRAVFFDLAQPSPGPLNLYTRSDFVTDNPNPQFLQNADGSTLFTRVLLVDTSNPDTVELSVFRTDTGARLCGPLSVNRQPADTFSAEILDASAPAGSDTVSIRRNGVDLQGSPCALPPAASLAVAPQPLAFGAIVNNTTRDLAVTFSNPGGDPVEVTALAASAHFVPLNFTSFTLQGGGSATRTIQFRPGGTTASFNENLTITRNPAVGAAVVNATGSGTPPPPVITGFTPSCGPVGTAVTITGTGFTGVSTVRFNTTAAAVATSSATQITTAVPAGATTGRISVVTPGGTATSASDFAVGALPVVTITANDAAAGESANPGQFTLSRTGSTAAALTVGLGIGGTASPGADYASLAATKTFSAGSPTATIDVTPSEDTIDESDQTVVLTVAPGACYAVGTPSTATVTIADNDPPPALSITGGTFLETDTGGSFRVAATVTLSARSEKDVSVNYSTFTGTRAFIERCVPLCLNGICTPCRFECLPAALITSTATGGPIGSACGAAGIDFIHGSGTVTFAAGSTDLTRNIIVRSCGDSVVESDDTFFVGLNSPTNATISNSGCGNNDTAVATILNNDTNTGSFDLVPAAASVASRERLNYAFAWTVPEPLNWHDLKFLQLRIRDGEDTVFSVLFDEASKTFSLVNKAGEFKHGFAPGSANRLHTPQVTLHLEDTTVVASGPTSPTVTLNLSLSFKTKHGGRTYIVEVAAVDDLGNQSAFAKAGTLTVRPRK